MTNERCKVAAEITAAMVSINEASQLKWSRHRDADVRRRERPLGWRLGA